MRILKLVLVGLLLTHNAWGMEFKPPSLDKPSFENSTKPQTLKEKFGDEVVLWLDQGRLGAGRSWDLHGDIVARYWMNDNAADTVITDQQGTNGTLSVNTDTRDVAGQISNAIDFQAANLDLVDCNQTFQTTLRSDFSVSMWVKPDDGQPVAPQVFYGSVNAASEDRFALYLDTNGSLFALYESNNTSNTFSSSVVFINGAETWHQIVYTGNATTMMFNLYFDGVNVGADDTTTDFSLWTSVDNLYIGALNTNGVASLYFDGPIDDVMVFDKEFTAQEVSDIYNKGTGTEGLRGPDGCWDDISGNAYNAKQGVEAAQVRTDKGATTTNEYRVFDGTADYLDTGDTFQSTFRTSFTIGCWIRPSDGHPAALQYICGTANAVAEDRILLFIGATGALSLVYESNNDLVTTQVPPGSAYFFSNGQQDWYFITYTITSGGVARLYIDGIEVDSSDASGVTMSAWTSSDNLYLGCYNADGTATSYWGGDISNFWIVGKALTTVEINQMYLDTKDQYNL